MDETRLVSRDDQLRPVAGLELAQQPTGGACAVLALWGSAAGLGEQTGQPVSPVIPWPTLVAVGASCLVLALIAGVLPARLKQRRRLTG